MRKRKDLRIIISSATLDSEAYAKFFTTPTRSAQILSIEGRCFPVDLLYLTQPCDNYLTQAVNTVCEIHRRQPLGDVLVFLPGVDEITSFLGLLREENLQGVESLPLYSGLDLNEQQKVFRVPGQGVRRVIASTNISETSVTIEGVTYVIDCCFTKQKIYDRGVESLVTVPVSQSQAQQRAGRAGRVRPGKCFRLCTEDTFAGLFVQTQPEILRADLAPVVLFLKGIGVENVGKFEFLSPLKESAVIEALEKLYCYGAIDENGQLTTDIGYKLVELPLDLSLSVALLNSCKDAFRCSEEMLTIVSALSVQSLFYTSLPESIVNTKRRLGAKEGDHISLMNILAAYRRMSNFQDRRKFCIDHKLNLRALQRASATRDQLRKMLHRLKLNVVSCECDVEPVLRCLATGLFTNAAQREPAGTYRTVRQEESYSLHPTSVLTLLKPPWVVFSHVVRQDKAYIREATEIDGDWLAELVPDYFQDVRSLTDALHRRRDMRES